MPARPTQRLRSLPRITRVWLLLVLAAVTSSWSLAWVAPCSAHEQATAETPDDDDCCPNKRAAEQQDQDEKSDCSCPIDCGPCCSGMPPPAAMTVPAALSPLLLPGFTLLTFATATELPPGGAGHDILHVPRS